MRLQSVAGHRRGTTSRMRGPHGLRALRAGRVGMIHHLGRSLGKTPGKNLGRKSERKPGVVMMPRLVSLRWLVSLR